MNILNALFVVLLSGQITSAPPSALITSDQGIDGWKREQDGRLNYIIKLAPDTVRVLAEGGQATFEIPEYVLAFMSKVTVQVGTTAVERDPTMEELQREFQKQSTGPQLSMGTAEPRALENKFAEIDRNPASTTQIQNVSQNQFANGGSISVPPPSNFSSPSTSPAQSNFASNPALTGASGAASGSGNPALNNRQPTFANTSPQYPVPQAPDRFANSQGSISLSDPPSVTNPGRYNAANPAYPTTSPQTYSPLPNANAFSNTTNDGFAPVASSNYNASTNGLTPLANNSSFGNVNNGTYGNYASTPTVAPQYASPFINPSANYNPGTNYNNASTANPLGNSYNSPDLRFADAGNNAASLLNAAAANSQSAMLKEIEDLKRYYSSELEKSKVQIQQAYSADFVKKLEDETKKVELENKNELFWFKILSLILLVTCVYLGVWLNRLFQSYRNLQANSRSTFNLGT